MNKYAFYFAQEAFEVEYILLWLYCGPEIWIRILYLEKLYYFVVYYESFI